MSTTYSQMVRKSLMKLETVQSSEMARSRNENERPERKQLSSFT